MPQLDNDYGLHIDEVAQAISKVAIELGDINAALWPRIRDDETPQEVLEATEAFMDAVETDVLHLQNMLHKLRRAIEDANVRRGPSDDVVPMREVRA